MSTARLACAVSQRQEELGLSDLVVQGRGGPSPDTLQKVKRGERRVTVGTLRKLDRALQWPPGTAQEFLAVAPAEREHGAGPHQCSAKYLTDEELIAELHHRLYWRRQPTAERPQP